MVQSWSKYGERLFGVNMVQSWSKYGERETSLNIIPCIVTVLRYICLFR